MSTDGAPSPLGAGAGAGTTYLDAANRVGDWLLATADRNDDGWSWAMQPGAGSDRDIGVGWGTAGPTLFFVEAYRTTRDQRWADAARHGIRWMQRHVDLALQSDEDGAGCGLFTGIGGWVLILDEWARAADDPQAHQLARDLLEEIAGRATTTDQGTHWAGATEILWGAAGIGCLLLSLGPACLGDRAMTLAVGAGRWLIAEAEAADGGGICWGMGDPYRDDFRRFPNFAHGAAGIAFFLARLAQATGDQQFGDAALRAVDWIMTTVRTDDDTCAAFHHDPGGTDLFTLGWCHGPPGLGWLFRQLELTTGDPTWRTWLRRAARADRTSGIPAQREPGFWDNVARCCGSAGVAEFFLDLHALEGNDDDLAFATVMVDDLLSRAIIDGDGMRWSNVEFRYALPDLPPETTYMQGAAGIGSTLLRLHRQLAGDTWTVRWPHKPTWSRGGN